MIDFSHDYWENVVKTKLGIVFKIYLNLSLATFSKIDKTQVLKTGVSLMKVKSIAESSLGAFCNTLDLH